LGEVTSYQECTHDVLGVLFDESKKRFHACLWIEYPLPGSLQGENVVRLKSKFHHTEGADTFEGALQHIAELEPRFTGLQHVWRDLGHMMSRNFKDEGYASVMYLGPESFCWAPASS
jgi:hypothetical protein